MLKKDIKLEILTSINDLLDNGNGLDLDRIHELFKNEISDKEFYYIIFGFIDEGHIKNLEYKIAQNGKHYTFLNRGRVYVSERGLDFINKVEKAPINDSLEKIASEMAKQTQILEQIKSLNSSDIEAIKQGLIKLKNKDETKKLPIDTIINAISLITSIASTIK